MNVVSPTRRWQRVVIRLRVRRLFCDDLTCQARTFTEQVAGLTVPYGRRTVGLTTAPPGLVRQLAGVVAPCGGMAVVRS